VDLQLSDKAVLITGCSGGIGSATARAFAREGAQVVLHYNRNRAAADDLARETGGMPLQADLRDEVSVDAAFARITDSFGGLDLCIANAGVYPTGPAPVAEMSVERWRATMEDNLTSVFLTARGFLRNLRRTDEASLVLIGSAAGTFGEAGHAEYSATKAALQGLMLSLKNEIVQYSSRGRVNMVSPGWTLTPMAEGVLDDEMRRVINATRPIADVATAEEIAGTILAVASSAFAHVSGQTVLAAGGQEGRLLNDPRTRPTEEQQ
jgi:3-oxoacyl-[acyl-carrier protein] reductase